MQEEETSGSVKEGQERREINIKPKHCLFAVSSVAELP